MYRTKLAYETWKSKYKYGDETPLQTFERVARALASVEQNPDEWYNRFLRTLIRFDETGEPAGLKCTVGGRITANVGTSYNKATLLNCFISGPVRDAHVHYTRKTETGDLKFDVDYSTDDTPDDLINIFLTIVEQAKTLASEGGYGINFDFIRPRGSLIKGTGIKHPGVVAYSKIWNSVSECIVQGDTDGYTDKIKNHIGNEAFKETKRIVKAMTRKGAMLGSLSVKHPDAEEFIRAKQQSGVLTKFNISVVIDDEFMAAVEKDGFYDQEFGGKVYKRIRARDLYNLIMESCYNRAEPGVLFCDNMRKNNPLSYLGKLTSTNPCGEIPGLSTITTVCLLGSVNLTQYVKIGSDRVPYFDFEEYEIDIKIFMRMLDNVNDLTYVPLPSYKWVIDNLRQVGMGINGLGSTLAMLGIPYNSEEAQEFTKKICSMKENLTWQISAELAKEKGTFKAYDKEQFESTEYFNSDRISDETRELLRRYGARNAKTTTNPPLGNSSLVSDNTSNGIEPIFLLEYERKVICKKWPEGLTADNIKDVLKRYKEKDYEYWRGGYDGVEYYYEPHNRGLCEVNVVRDYGYQWLLDNYPEKPVNDHKGLVTTKDLSIDDHLSIQSIVQLYNNQSVSKTCNLPNDYPFEGFKDLYIKAWKLGLNGFTTYRDGSMESVLSDIKKAEKKEIIARDIQLPDEFINGSTHIIRREGKKFYIHFSYLPEDHEFKFPVVIWIYTNAKYHTNELRVCNKAARNLSKLALTCGIDRKIVKATVDKANQDYPHNRLGRLVSLCLRHNVPREDILVSLMGIDGDNVSTLLTAVRKFLSNTLSDGTSLKGLKCPNCNGERMVMESGCSKCLDCTFVACG